MLWVEHVVIGLVLAWVYNKRNIRNVIVGSIGPDIFMIPLLLKTGMSKEEWDSIVDTPWAVFVYFPHSIFSLLLVPSDLSVYWFAHIIADVVSHRGKWSIRPFYPLSDWYYEGYYEPWVCLCYTTNHPTPISTQSIQI